ncbi:hypothetical protein IGI04_036892 [Brassica rapa subsp. trilocularis]|uniref:Uncharacterized protein n=1 Tax=Brassica rapa subsp. trilocularis TaxID=1813537 RepID=A0ABQ7LGQ6_BRACM|nr:hypothetical protein IGI04_036892 [Brassica rapa subsp. trilocularis]
MRLNRRVGFNAIINSSLENLSLVVVCITSFRILQPATHASHRPRFTVWKPSNISDEVELGDETVVMIQPNMRAVLRFKSSLKLKLLLTQVKRSRISGDHGWRRSNLCPLPQQSLLHHDER